jgi:hypothetical protein
MRWFLAVAQALLPAVLCVRSAHRVALSTENSACLHASRPASVLSYPRLRGPAGTTIQRVRGGSEEDILLDENAAIINELVDRVQRMQASAGVSAADDLIIAYQVQSLRL